jgi:hypothetical protein
METPYVLLFRLACGLNGFNEEFGSEFLKKGRV